MYSKPYLPIPDQIARLESRGMSIDNHNRASEYLQRIGYYRLSAYWHPLRKRDQVDGTVLDQFEDGATFKEVTDLYTFDGRLRLIALDALERLEVSLRTEVALTLGRHHPQAHRDTHYVDGNFSRIPVSGKPSKHKEWLQRLDERALKSKDQFAEHFRSKYPNDHMPIWMAVELLDFGPLSHLIAGLKFADKKTICQDYPGLPPQVLSGWVRTLSFTRNVCAHHSRLWNRRLISQPKLPKAGVPAELMHLTRVPGQTSRFYAAACIMQFMLRNVNPRTQWRSRFKNHISTFPVSERLSLAAAGFPQGWDSEQLWDEP